MDTYHGIEQLPDLSGSVVTIGNYDGIHRGHVEVIRQLCRTAAERHVPAVLITFDPPPSFIITGKGRPPKAMLTPVDRKLAMLATTGLDIVVILDFNRAFSEISAEQFLADIIVNPLRPVEIVIGNNHRFGHNREGDARFLRRMSHRFQFEVTVLPDVNSEDLIASSTNIRQLLLAGNCLRATQLLGRPYEISGRVVSGAGRGKDLGFPTVNVEPHDTRQLVPANGVYVVAAIIENQRIFGMGNIGTRPTFGETERTIEAHFFKTDLNSLSGTGISLEFLHRFRDELKFPDSGALIAQLKADFVTANEWLNQNQGERQIHAPVD